MAMTWGVEEELVVTPGDLLVRERLLLTGVASWQPYFTLTLHLLWAGGWSASGPSSARPPVANCFLDFVKNQQKKTKTKAILLPQETDLNKDREMGLLDVTDIARYHGMVRRSTMRFVLLFHFISF